MPLLLRRDPASHTPIYELNNCRCRVCMQTRPFQRRWTSTCVLACCSYFFRRADFLDPHFKFSRDGLFLPLPVLVSGSTITLVQKAWHLCKVQNPHDLGRTSIFQGYTIWACVTSVLQFLMLTSSRVDSSAMIPGLGGAETDSDSSSVNGIAQQFAHQGQG